MTIRLDKIAPNLLPHHALVHAHNIIYKKNSFLNDRSFFIPFVFRRDGPDSLAFCFTCWLPMYIFEVTDAETI